MQQSVGFIALSANVTINFNGIFKEIIFFISFRNGK